MSLAIFSCHHRAPEFPLTTSIFHTLVSGMEAPPGAQFLSDLDGNNISSKNVYSELRHQYFVWKNLLPRYSHVGFEHYSRPFFIDPMPLSRLIAEYPEFLAIRKHFLAEHARFQRVNSTILGQYMRMRQGWDKDIALFAERWICEHDIIVVRGDYTDIENQWKSHQDPSIWDDVVRLCQGANAFGAAGCHIDFHNKFNHWLNSYIMRSDLFHDYMTFCFDVLGDFERRLPAPSNRLFGYISERLFNLWLYQRRIETPTLRVLELPFLWHSPEMDAGMP
jgi:Domain of unknown function (DUF4422)